MLTDCISSSGIIQSAKIFELLPLGERQSERKQRIILWNSLQKEKCEFDGGSESLQIPFLLLPACYFMV